MRDISSLNVKKGHNECSKEDIRFCEDFELSEVLLQ